MKYIPGQSPHAPLLGRGKKIEGNGNTLNLFPAPGAGSLAPCPPEAAFFIDGEFKDGEKVALLGQSIERLAEGIEDFGIAPFVGVKFLGEAVEIALDLLL